MPSLPIPKLPAQPPAWKQQSSTGPECWYCNRMLLFTTSNSRTLLSHDATRRNCDDDGPNLTLCMQSFGVFLSRNSMRDSLIFLKHNDLHYQLWVRIEYILYTYGYTGMFIWQKRNCSIRLWVPRHFLKPLVIWRFVFEKQLLLLKLRLPFLIKNYDIFLILLFYTKSMTKLHHCILFSLWYVYIQGISLCTYMHYSSLSYIWGAQETERSHPSNTEY